MDAHELAQREILAAIANVPTRREDKSAQDFHAALMRKRRAAAKAEAEAC